jgi:hypothetical protein
MKLIVIPKVKFGRFIFRILHQNRRVQQKQRPHFPLFCEMKLSIKDTAMISHQGESENNESMGRKSSHGFAQQIEAYPRSNSNI